MKRKYWCTYMLGGALLVASGVLQARDTGAGVNIGFPTGFTVKHWTGPTTAWDACLGWSFGDNPEIAFHADHLWHQRFQVKSSMDPESTLMKDSDFLWYYGIGGRLKAETNSLIGARFPVGLGYMPFDSQLELFMEVAPILDLIPGTGLSGNAGIGARVYL